MSVFNKLERLSTLEGYKKPITYKGKIRLDTNENMAIPIKLFNDIIKDINVDVREYPFNYDKLKSALARYLNLKKEYIAIGNGSDQLIDLLLSNLCNTTVTIKPTFSFYIVRCKLYDIAIKEVLLNEELLFEPKEIINSNADICYISSPNNPTGNQFNKDDIINIIKYFKGLVIIDEAYAEFARYSLKDLIKEYDNLIILRTMSKAFGLAGLRIGYALANPKLISMFNNIIQYPYPISSLSIEIALGILKRKNEIINIIENIKRERERVFNEINSMGLHAYRSDANFIMFEASKSIFKGLFNEGIVIKDLGKINGKDCYRVSIASNDINDKFINALRRVTL